MNKDETFEVGDRVIILNGSTTFKIPVGSIGTIHQITDDKRFLIEMSKENKQRWLLRDHKHLYKI